VSGLERAELQALDRQGRKTGTFPVQFNPTSLTLQLTNSVDGASSRGRQRQQYNGTSSTTLNVTLEFDTADEGTTASPVDVRTRTADIAQFMLPGGKNSKQAPPKVQFHWGTFELAGVMTSLNEELTLFSADGVPLRAKTTIQIKEQDPKYEALEAGPGANAGADVPASGEGDGGTGGGPSDRAAEALAGETPADFLARNGLAPEAWRAIGGALSALADGIELEAGVAVDFSSTLAFGGSVGVSAGFQAGIDVGVDARLGLTADAGAGLALAAAGGLTAATQSAASAAAAGAADAARERFGVARQATQASGRPASAAAQFAAGVDSRQPVATAPSVRTLAPQPASPAPLPPRADPRATSFGFGVPLRDRVTSAAAEGAVGTYVVIGPRLPATQVTDVSARRGRGTPWEQLAATDATRRADAEQHRRSPPCGCHRCDPRGRQRYRR
jgi:hypothetical protein